MCVHAHEIYIHIYMVCAHAHVQVHMGYVRTLEVLFYHSVPYCFASEPFPEFRAQRTPGISCGFSPPAC